MFNIWKRFLTWFGDLYIATTPPAMKWCIIDTILIHARPGDIILRGFEKKYVDSLFIPGRFTHSGVIVGKNKIVHAVSEGVIFDTLADFVLFADRVMLLRPYYPDDAGFTVERALSLVGSEYDFLFKNANKEYYCHELTVNCLSAAGVDIGMSKVGYWPFIKSVYLAEKIISKCKILYDFDPLKKE
jgi:uncharacterized protein YycO